MGSGQSYHKITTIECLSQSTAPPKLPQKTNSLQLSRLCHWLAILRVSHSEQERNALIEFFFSCL